MDLIERVFDISPDGGTGATEAAYIIAVCAIVILVVWRQRIKRLVSLRLRRAQRS